MTLRVGECGSTPTSPQGEVLVSDWSGAHEDGARPEGPTPLILQAIFYGMKRKGPDLGGKVRPRDWRIWGGALSRKRSV
jgi:hypothetical protein